MIQVAEPRWPGWYLETHTDTSCARRLSSPPRGCTPDSSFTVARRVRVEEEKFTYVFGVMISGIFCLIIYPVVVTLVI